MTRKVKDNCVLALIYLAAFFSVLLLIGIIAYVFVKGVGSISLEFLTTVTSALQGTTGIAGNIVNTLYVVVLTLLIATPIGIGSAIYLNEYAKPGKIVRLIEFTTETLSGIPSIIFGLFGMVFFGTTLGFGYSILTGALTLTLMVLPLITRNTQEALKTVPDSYRSGAVRYYHRSNSGSRTYRRGIGSTSVYGRKWLSSSEGRNGAFAQDHGIRRYFDDPVVSEYVKGAVQCGIRHCSSSSAHCPAH